MNEIGRKITDKLIELHGSAGFTIAFLPYKRSMWNSMQSVFEECKASGADAHVYPIPYYRMRPNHEIDRVDSDFELFGDIAEPIETLQRADYVAIHYQYEDHNKVTNMLPEYFTKALKERYRAKVVFLPYGIYGNNSKYSLQPGCRDVDYAFVESESARQLFVSAWATQGVDFEGRCWGYGSAKLDMARRITKEIPDEWKDIIGDRSVTLICNSLGPFLESPNRRLEQYKHQIEQETRSGNVVIFRPHPLLWQTIISMMRDMGGKYGAFLAWVRNQDNVIIDDSEYLERAMSAADKLISDPSSVVSMWLQTGKEFKPI